MTRASKSCSSKLRTQAPSQADKFSGVFLMHRTMMDLRLCCGMAAKRTRTWGSQPSMAQGRCNVAEAQGRQFPLGERALQSAALCDLELDGDDGRHDPRAAG